MSKPPIDLQEYKDLYVETAEERIDSIYETLDILRNHVHDYSEWHTLYIDAHSLKGQSLVMGYTNIGDAAKEIETIAKNVEEKKSANNVLIDALYRLVQTIDNAVGDIAENKQEPNLSEYIEQLRSVASKL